MPNKNLTLILKITTAAEQALIAYLSNDQKGIKKYLQAARDAIDAVLQTL